MTDHLTRVVSGAKKLRGCCKEQHERSGESLNKLPWGEVDKSTWARAAMGDVRCCRLEGNGAKVEQGWQRVGKRGFITDDLTSGLG